MPCCSKVDRSYEYYGGFPKITPKTFFWSKIISGLTNNSLQTCVACSFLFNMGISAPRKRYFGCKSDVHIIKRCTYIYIYIYIFHLCNLTWNLSSHHDGLLASNTAYHV